MHKTTQKLGRVRAVRRLCGFYRGLCLTIEEKARKNLSQDKSIAQSLVQLCKTIWEPTNYVTISGIK
jgi:hypothetical protein